MLNYEHLLDQADKLARPSGSSVRQVDLRRSISSPYYGLFHFTLTAMADYLIGRTKRATMPYKLAYRSVDHRTLRDVSAEAMKHKPSSKYASYVPRGGWGTDIQAFATAALELQERRHLADYDPGLRLRAVDARLAVLAARSAAHHFNKASASRRNPILALLAFPPR